MTIIILAAAALGLIVWAINQSDRAAPAHRAAPVKPVVQVVAPKPAAKAKARPAAKKRK